jgi:hypothetical protein
VSTLWQRSVDYANVGKRDGYIQKDKQYTKELKKRIYKMGNKNTTKNIKGILKNVSRVIRK